MKIRDKLIIGIGYRIGAGKDTMASYLCNHAGYKVMRFADALKEAACTIFGWERSDLEDMSFKMTVDEFWGETPRVLLQRMGTEAMRENIRKDIWVKALERRIRSSSNTRIVIPDVRFTNEAEAVKAWGGYVVKVTRNSYMPPNATTQQLKHKSETEMDDYDGWFYAVENDGDIEKLNSNTAMLSRILENEYVDRRPDSAGRTAHSVDHTPGC